MQENQNLMKDLDFRLVADFFVSHERDELAPAYKVGVTRSPPVFHASFIAMEELEKKRRFVTRRSICHREHLLPRMFIFLGTANPLSRNAVSVRRISICGIHKNQGRCFQMVKKLLKRIFVLLVITSLALTGGVSQSIGAESPELYPVVETWR